MFNIIPSPQLVLEKQLCSYQTYQTQVIWVLSILTRAHKSCNIKIDMQFADKINIIIFQITDKGYILFTSENAANIFKW